MNALNALPRPESYQAVIDSFVANGFKFIGRVIDNCSQGLYIATHVFAQKGCVIVLREVIPLEAEDNRDLGWWEGKIYWWPLGLGMDDFKLTLPLRASFWAWTLPPVIHFENDRSIKVEDLTHTIFVWYSTNAEKIAEGIPFFDAAVLPPSNMEHPEKFWERFSLKRLGSHVDNMMNTP